MKTRAILSALSILCSVPAMAQVLPNLEDSKAFCVDQLEKQAQKISISLGTSPRAAVKAQDTEVLIEEKKSAQVTVYIGARANFDLIKFDVNNLGPSCQVTDISVSPASLSILKPSK